MGDAQRNHQVFVTVDNHQDEHQGTIVEATCIFHGILALVLFESRALDSFISSFLVQ